MARIGDRLRAAAAGEEGSSPVEFVLVGTLLTVLTLGILQFGLAVYVRNVVHDAAVEGAYHAALADTTLADGRTRTREIVARTIGAGYSSAVAVREVSVRGSSVQGSAMREHAVIEVTVTTTLPLVGLLGAPRSLEVTAHAPAESFD